MNVEQRVNNIKIYCGVAESMPRVVNSADKQCFVGTLGGSDRRGDATAKATWTVFFGERRFVRRAAVCPLRSHCALLHVVGHRTATGPSESALLPYDRPVVLPMGYLGRLRCPNDFTRLRRVRPWGTLRYPFLQAPACDGSISRGRRRIRRTKCWDRHRTAQR